MATTYKIHPAIGIARVGDSEEIYIEPQIEAGLPELLGGGEFKSHDFRSADGKLRRQGARFQVYRYDDDDQGRPVQPGSAGVAGVEWTVHLANKKAIWYEFQTNLGENGYAPDHPPRNASVSDPEERTRMIIDPGPRTVSQPGQRAAFSRDDNPDGYPMTFPPQDLEPYGIDTLGEILSDDRGRLVVAGGHGRSGSMIHPPHIGEYANNDGWWDDTSDGPVTATVVMDDGSRVPVDVPSWVLVTPPAYAPQIVNLVSLYDTLLDAYVRNVGYRPEVYSGGLWNQDYRPNYKSEVLPILRRASRYPWVVAIPTRPHDFDFDLLGDPDPRYDGMRQYYLGIVRPPSAPNTFASPDNGYPLMPWLAGDNALEPQYWDSTYLTVTDTQYFFLMQWAAGKFDVGEPPPVRPGEALDRNVLENCVGGAFSPGIEMTWICRNPRLYSAPFRIRHRRDVGPPLSLGESFELGLEPGDVTKYMAVPWQADFNECSSQPIDGRWIWWWPAQRPLFVYVDEKKDGQYLQVPWVGTDDNQNAPNYVQFADDIEMVENWKKLGFVFNEGSDEEPLFLEVERTLGRRPQRRKE